MAATAFTAPGHSRGTTGNLLDALDKSARPDLPETAASPLPAQSFLTVQLLSQSSLIVRFILDPGQPSLSPSFSLMASQMH